MNKIKGYYPSKKCAIYIKRMISKNKWKINERIPTIKNIAMIVCVSPITVRKVIKQFERERIIRNEGSLGFYLINNLNIIKSSINLSQAKNIMINITASQLLKNGAKLFQNWVINYNKETKELLGLNLISGNEIKSSLKEIFYIKDNIITLQNLLNTKDLLFKKTKDAYDRQIEVLPMMQKIFTHKKELGINE